MTRLFLILMGLASTPQAFGQAPAPWLNKSLSPSERAERAVAAMSLDEKIGFLHTRFGTSIGHRPKPEGALDSAGYGPGLPRLGIPPLQETDAELGVADPYAIRNATALPSGLALGATFNPRLAESAGATIGAEARAQGFDVLLAGAANLVRDPRTGRNFEYLGEDPLLTGTLAGAEVAGIQRQHVISTLKHFALNDQENGRVILSSDIKEAAARESDLLAFEIALERGAPGAVMTGYNRINGDYASENQFLVDTVLKKDWGFAGWVMSDWTATHSTEKAALNGLDQESGEDNDPAVFFGAPLKAAVTAGSVPVTRIDDMVRRILRSEFTVGIVDDPPKTGGHIDFGAHAAVADAVAREGIVLLKNEAALLPLKRSLRHVLVIGANADRGVLSGSGSSQVTPQGAVHRPGNPPARFFGRQKLYDPSAPLEALRHALPDTAVDYLDGEDTAAAVRAARGAETVLVFAEQWMVEGADVPDLSLLGNQDDLIAAVAAANPRTVVVLETGGPVTMPWLAAVPAVLEAWYSGQRGGDAIAAVLSGHADAAGRLPVTFPRDVDQLPRPILRDRQTTVSNPGEPIKGVPFSVDYDIEGADVGYKWFARTGRKPLFPFGYGLSYTQFIYGAVDATPQAGTVSVHFVVKNRGRRQGTDTPQVYLDSPLFGRRLVGWRRVTLRPGESRRITLSVDPRLLARFDVKTKAWHIAAARYTLSVRPNAADDGPARSVTLAARDLRP